MMANDETDRINQKAIDTVHNDEIHIQTNSNLGATGVNAVPLEEIKLPSSFNDKNQNKQHFDDSENEMYRTKSMATKENDWVKFEDDDKDNISVSKDTDEHRNHMEIVSFSNQDNKKTFQDTAPAAVLTTESVHITLNNKTNNHSVSSAQQPPQQQLSAVQVASSVTALQPAALNDIPSPAKVISHSTTAITTTPSATTSPSHPITITMLPETSTPNSGLRTIELSNVGRIREGFANGDVIVTLMPINTKWPWITPAVFRPELVPEELMAQGLTLTVEEYVHAMETLVNDFRFTIYNICYKRVLCCWILFAFAVLLGVLFSGLTGIFLFSLGVCWLFLNAIAIFFCMWMKLRLARGLERCMASVNKQLLRHKIILALDDRGKISCHKVNLCFIYYEPAQCVSYLNEFIERNEQSGSAIEPGWEQRLDVSASDIVIQGSNTTRLSRKQARGEELLLRYSQRWGKEYLRRRLDWIVAVDGIHEMPRHLQSSLCPCQFTEQILYNKPKGTNSCCQRLNAWTKTRGFSFC